jgi:ATP-dependent Lon protease
MSNSNSLYRMPKKEDEKSKRKKSPKMALKRGRNSDDDDNTSIDSKGNIRNLIDYEYTSDDSENIKNVPKNTRSPVLKRKAAIIAEKKINKIIQKEQDIDRKDKNSKKTINESTNSTFNKLKNNIKSNELKRLTPSKRKYPYKISNRKHNAKRRTPFSRRSSNDVSTIDTNNTSDKDEYETEEDYEEEQYTNNDTSDGDFETEEDEYDESEDEYTEESEESDYKLEKDEETEEETEESDYEVEEDIDEKELIKKSKNKGFEGILLALGGSHMDNPMKPKKYNMKKESENVKKFVKLLTSPVEENTIDKQIEQFKLLNDEKQKDLIIALENRPTSIDSSIDLMLKILTLKVSPEIRGMILSKYNSLQNLDNSSNEYFKIRAWLDKVVSIPFGVYKDIPVRLEYGTEKCSEFMKTANKYLDESVYGQNEAKLQIMQFISTKIANPEHRGLSLLLIGAPGIGKTTLIKNGIAKALSWPFQFISLGGDSDASTYTGHQLVYESSHCGKIVNSLIASKSMSTILMFDEVDKISQTPKGEEVMNLLIHLTDPVQNSHFEDKYLAGVPIDLSKIMFVFSANDINKIDKVLLDRMMVIDLKGYDLNQKTAIAEQYLLPNALKEVNLSERISISKDILTNIVQEYANEEKGVRELKRCIEQITQKINMLRMYNSPDLPFYIKDFSLPFIVKKEHIKLFLKKKENTNLPPMGMYS